MSQKNIIERAYELAATGKYISATGIGRELSREGYFGVSVLVSGLGFRREIKRRIQLARVATALIEDERPTAH